MLSFRGYRLVIIGLVVIGLVVIGVLVVKVVRIEVNVKIFGWGYRLESNIYCTVLLLFYCFLYLYVIWEGVEGGGIFEKGEVSSI